MAPERCVGALEVDDRGAALLEVKVNLGLSRGDARDGNYSVKFAQTDAYLFEIVLRKSYRREKRLG